MWAVNASATRMLEHGLAMSRGWLLVPVAIPLQPGMVDARRNEQKYLRRNASLCKCVSELGDVIAVHAYCVVHAITVVPALTQEVNACWLHGRICWNTLKNGFRTRRV
jgi:hypothetical protein